jgi:hypothetical protein
MEIIGYIERIWKFMACFRETDATALKTETVSLLTKSYLPANPRDVTTLKTNISVLLV